MDSSANTTDDKSVAEIIATAIRDAAIITAASKYKRLSGDTASVAGELLRIVFANRVKELTGQPE